MNVMWLAVSVTVLMGANKDNTPIVNIVPQHVFATEAECLSWRAKRYETDWGDTDPITGLVVDNYYFECVPQDIDKALRDMEPFIGNN